MAYRDELEAAQHRIAELENQVEELKGESPPPPPPPSEKPKGRGCLFFGLPGVVLFIVAAIIVGSPLCTRACGAMTDSTAPALAALRACDRARTLLGDDVGWGTVGCSNCEGESGGDPFNGGCHSSSTWSMPVSGSRGHGTYAWSIEAPPGKQAGFGGGHVTMSTGESISIEAKSCQ